MTSMVPGWEVTYPTQCNGRMADLGYVASLGYGGSHFVAFSRDESDEEPYCDAPLTKAARARLIQMRKDFRFRR